MKEIACEQVLMAKMAEADGERPELSQEDLEAHLSACENCQAEVARIRNVDVVLQRSSRADTAVDLWPVVSRSLDQRNVQITWQPFVVALILLLGYKLVEIVPDEDPGMALKLVPLVIFAALMIFIRENPFKINSELVLEK